MDRLRRPYEGTSMGCRSGPVMTVDALRPDLDGKLYCIWFEGSDRQSGFFNPETLNPFD